MSHQEADAAVIRDLYAPRGMIVEVVRRRLLRISPATREGLLVAGFALWGSLEQLLTRHDASRLVGLALLLPLLAAVMLRKRFPLPAALLLGGVAPLRAAVGAEAFADVTPLQICVVIVWAQGRYGPSRSQSAFGGVVALSGVTAGLLLTQGSRPVAAAVFLWLVVFFFGVGAAGVLARWQSEEARAERAIRLGLELEREESVRAALAEERARIARELHDLVAHGVTAISVQAGVADQWLERDPLRAVVALGNARRQARLVLADMRRLLSVLRDDDTAPSSGGDTGDQSGAMILGRRVRAGRPAWVVEWLPALALAAYGVLEIKAPSGGGLGVASIIGALALGAVLLPRRRAPLLVAAALVFVLIARAGDGQLRTASHSATLGLALAAWSLSLHQNRSMKRLAGLALLEAGVAIALPLSRDRVTALDFVVLALVPMTAFAGGTAVRCWREDAVAERTRQQSLIAEADAPAESAVVGERARVARELHDVVAHSLSIVSVQCGAAETLTRSDPPRARTAVAAVLAAAHQALDELRHLLHLLGGEEGESAAYGPQPGLATIGRLVSSAQELGLFISFSDESVDSAPTAGQQLTVFRILQEALTNVHKHAGPVGVQVRLSKRPGEFEVEIQNDLGRTIQTSESGGNGLVGMNERVRLYGGKLQAGPDGNGHWTVRAILPSDTEDSS